MDWNAAIERHRDALKRVLATLAALAGLTSPLAGEDGSARQGEAEVLAVLVDPHPEVQAEGEPRRTLPRHLHRAVLRLLRPAEAAARRLIIVAARDLSTLSSSPLLGVSSRFAKGKSVVPVARWKAGERRDAAKQRGPGREGGVQRAHSITLPLTDPLRRERRLPASRDMPRISIPGWSEPAPLPLPPTPYDPIDATRLTLRLAAIARALDDLPREARRFARWRSRNVSTAQAEERSYERKRHENRVRRTWPLRLGRPPGSPSGRRPVHAVHRILEDVHGLAFWVLESPDTS
jgi:hypothetical protein